MANQYRDDDNAWRAFWTQKSDRMSGDASPAGAGAQPLQGYSLGDNCESEGCVDHPALAEFWRGALMQAANMETRSAHPGAMAPTVILELASGMAAPGLRHAQDVLGGGLNAFPIALDLSEHAVRTAIKTDVSPIAGTNADGDFTGAAFERWGVAASARDTPFADQSVSLLLSQFGLEYAGFEAFGEVARLLAPGGMFMAVCHLNDGAIHDECRANEAILQFQRETGWLEKASAAVSARHRLSQGAATRADAAKAHNDFLAAFQATEKRVAREQQQTPAAYTLATIIQGLMTLYNKLSEYDIQHVQAWIAHRRSDLEDYRMRMASMQKAALSSDEIDAVKTRLAEKNIVFKSAEPLFFGATERPAAWGLIASKQM